MERASENGVRAEDTGNRNGPSMRFFAMANGSLQCLLLLLLFVQHEKLKISESVETNMEDESDLTLDALPAKTPFELERDPAEVALLGEVPADGALLVIIKCIDGLNLQDLQTMRRGNLVLRVNGKLLDSRVRFSNSTYKC